MRGEYLSDILKIYWNVGSIVHEPNKFLTQRKLATYFKLFIVPEDSSIRIQGTLLRVAISSSACAKCPICWTSVANGSNGIFSKSCRNCRYTGKI